MEEISEDHLEEEARQEKLIAEVNGLDLYVVRHAVAYERDAERWPDDARRPLTPKGEQRFREAVKGLTSVAAPEVEVVLSSPFARAWRTAEILAEAGWAAPVECEQLEPDYPPHKMDPVLERYAEAASVAVVGHRPGLHELVVYYLTGASEGAEVRIKKGGVVCLRFDGTPGPGAATLRWLLTPRILRTCGD
jgi:phosphohistidine phosphatase